MDPKLGTAKCFAGPKRGTQNRSFFWFSNWAPAVRLFGPAVQGAGARVWLQLDVGIGLLLPIPSAPPPPFLPFPVLPLRARPSPLLPSSVCIHSLPPSLLRRSAVPCPFPSGAVLPFLDLPSLPGFSFASFGAALFSFQHTCMKRIVVPEHLGARKGTTAGKCCCSVERGLPASRRFPRLLVIRLALVGARRYSNEAVRKWGSTSGSSGGEGRLMSGPAGLVVYIRAMDVQSTSPWVPIFGSLLVPKMGTKIGP